MKRFVCFLLSIIIAASFAGCGGFETVEEHNKKLESSYGSSEASSSQESSSSHNEEERTTENNTNSDSSQESGGESSKSGSAKQSSSAKSGGNQTTTNQPSGNQPNSAQQPSGQTPAAPPVDTTPSQTPPSTPDTIQVTISVQCTVLVGNSNLAEPYRPYVPSNGYIQGTTQVTIPKNGTVFDALQALNLNPAPTYDGSVKRKDVYITSINHIPEKACGGQSGWKYKVNGSIPNLSCSDYPLQGGETIEWYYAEHVFD